MCWRWSEMRRQHQSLARTRFIRLIFQNTWLGPLIYRTVGNPVICQPMKCWSIQSSQCRSNRCCQVIFRLIPLIPSALSLASRLYLLYLNCWCELCRFTLSIHWQLPTRLLCLCVWGCSLGFIWRRRRRSILVVALENTRSPGVSFPSSFFELVDLLLSLFLFRMLFFFIVSFYFFFPDPPSCQVLSGMSWSRQRASIQTCPPPYTIRLMETSLYDLKIHVEARGTF